MNEDGLLLNKKNLYYSFFVEGEFFVYEAERFPSFKENMSLFPYSFTDGREIMIIDGVHEVWFYFREPKEVAIQSYYVKGGEVIW